MSNFPGVLHPEREVARRAGVDWCIRSPALNVLQVTSDLDIQPTRAWAQGERYLSKSLDVETAEITQVWRVRPWGIWGFNTDGLVDSTDVEPHLLFLLSLLEPQRAVVQRYIDDAEQYTIRTTVQWESNVGHGGFAVPSRTLARVSEICHYLQFKYVDFFVATEGTQA